MSIRVLNLVWEHSKQRGRALLVLLAIADFADDTGRAFPGVETLAKKGRMSERNTRYVIATLEASGELAIDRGAGRNGTHLYRVMVTPNLELFEQGRGQRLPRGAKFAPPAMGGTDGVQPASARGAIAVAPEPSVNVIEPSGEALRARATRLSPDWQLPKKWGEWALEKQPTWTPEHVREVAENFRDHWVAVPGRHGTKLDWLATWRKWVRGEGAMKGNGKPSGASPWWSSESSIIAMGKEVGLSPRAGESTQDFKGRIEARLHAH